MRAARSRRLSGDGVITASNVPGKKADARTEIVFVAGHLLSLRNRGIRENNAGEHFVFVAEADIKSEPGQHSPAIFGKEGQVVGMEGEAEGTEGLLVAGVTGRTLRGATVIGRDQVGQIVCDGTIAERSILKAQILAQVIGGRNVRAEFDGMLAVGPRNGVRVLRAAFIGESRSLQKSGNAHVEAVGNKRSEEHTSELQSRVDLVCRLLLEK